MRWRCEISSILIDGYNLIGIFHKDLEGQRKKLIDMLAAYGKGKGHDITVVFDGWKSGGAKEDHTVTGGVKVVYSRLGEKADLVIKRMLSSDRKQWVVVTSDREIADHAWSCGSVVISSEEFMDILGRPEKVSGDFELIDEDDFELRKRGSPRKLSRKEKAKRRALGKL